LKYSLKEFNSFGVESHCSNLYLINSIKDFYKIDISTRAQEKIILGAGTNILLKSEFISKPIFKIYMMKIRIKFLFQLEQELIGMSLFGGA
jgi:UDP-N-acetylenolpyruvoylglucosamine reductase